MKTKCLLLAIGIGSTLLLPLHAQTVNVLRDDFEDGVVHPDWNVSTTKTVNPFYLEQGGSLQAITIPPTQVGSNQWCTLKFSRSFQPVSDFDASFEISWDSNGLNSAMQNLYIVLYNPLGAEVATAGYYDAQSAVPGVFHANAGGNDYFSEDLSLAGTTSIRIARTNNTLTISFDGSIKLTANVISPVVRVGMLFEHHTWSGGSTFGRLSARDINIAGKLDVSGITPHIAAELEWLGAVGKTYDIEASGDLETWIPFETGIIGESKPIYRLISTRALREQHGWNSVFFRYASHPN